MPAQCTLDGVDAKPHFGRRVNVTFDAGFVSSDGGALLLREIDERYGVIERLARCFVDHRDPDWIEFSVTDLLRQRIFGLVNGYEDLEDHDRLRHDPLFALAVGRSDVLGKQRRVPERDEGKPLAGKSTLNRVERAADARTSNPRYHKVVVDRDACDDLLLDVFLEHHSRRPEQLIIDLDPSDIELHGQQQGRFYHGYYGHYCYLPLYLFIGAWPVGVRLRRADIDGCDGCLEELDVIVTRLRQRWPELPILVRGDSGFARDEIMCWCESCGIDFVFGLARNCRLEAEIAEPLEAMRGRARRLGRAVRCFREFEYQTERSWSRSRRVIAKVEALVGKTNPRFIVTSLPRSEARSKALYERVYCARGQMENYIKEQQLDLFGERSSTSTMPSNELRLYFSAFAHLLVVLLRKYGLASTPLGTATAGTIRAKLLKVGVIIKVSVRRLHVAISHAFPYAHTLRKALANLRAPP